MRSRSRLGAGHPSGARTMADSETESNFIHNIIDEDLRTGKRKEVYTRFPPEPNGYLHIGHAKSICLNFTTAQKYGGRCNLRYDDTNPTKEDEEYIDAIEEDIHWLGFQWTKKCRASDYFPIMYKAAEALIKKGLAFVDDLSADEIRAYRGTLTEPGKESPFRTRTVEENLRLFADMKAGKFAEGEKVLRAKIDMASPNINMRDPVLYRIAYVHHHSTGDTWCIYPMYDFAHPIEDAIEGITHSLCTMEFEDHRPLYDWVLDQVGFWDPLPQQIEFARLNLTGTVMSKRLLKGLVDDGTVSGWDDPRMPTIAGLRRRGYTPEAIRDFCQRIGVAKANSVVDASLLEYCIRDDLQGKTETRNVVFDPIKVVITNYPEGRTEDLEIENNPKVPELGKRHIPFSRHIYIDGADFMEVPAKKYFRLYPGNEVRLKGAYFIKCEDVIKNQDGSIKEIHASYDPETKSGSGFEGRKVRGTIHFVEAETAVPVTVREYGPLMIEDENGGLIPNSHSLTERKVLAEPLLREAEPDQRFQFFRHGFYMEDEVLSTEGEQVFNQIVDLKSGYKPKK